MDAPSDFWRSTFVFIITPKIRLVTICIVSAFARINGFSPLASLGVLLQHISDLLLICLRKLFLYATTSYLSWPSKYTSFSWCIREKPSWVSHVHAVFSWIVAHVFSFYPVGKHSACKVWLPLSACMFVTYSRATKQKAWSWSRLVAWCHGFHGLKKAYQWYIHHSLCPLKKWW